MERIDKLRVREEAAGAAIAVQAVPGASRDRVVGVLGDCLKVTTTAAPEKGKANKALAAILARALGVGARDVTLLSGRTRRRKTFRIAGLTGERLRVRLAKL